MVTLLLHLLRFLPMLCGGHRQVALENLALRHQLAVYKKMVNRPKLRSSDRLFWVALSKVGRLEASSRHRVTQYRPAMAAPPLPRVLGRTLRSPRGGPPARKPPDPGSRRTNGSGQSSLGRASHPWRTAEARNRGGRAYGLPAALDAAHTAVPDVANVPRQPCPGPSLHRFLHSPHRGLSGTLCPCRARSP